MSNSELTPGVTPITVKSLPLGASTPGQAAMANMNASNEKLLNINNIGGRRRNRVRGGSNGQIAVPQHQMLYTPVGGPETDPNAQTANLTKTGTQSQAWAVDDSKAAKMGGRRKTRRSRSGKIRRGGNTNWDWGCYSGGRSRRRKSRKNKKKTRRRN